MHGLAQLLTCSTCTMCICTHTGTRNVFSLSVWVLDVKKRRQLFISSLSPCHNYHSLPDEYRAYERAGMMPNEHLQSISHTHYVVPATKLSKSLSTSMYQSRSTDELGIILAKICKSFSRNFQT